MLILSPHTNAVHTGAEGYKPIGLTRTCIIVGVCMRPVVPEEGIFYSPSRTYGMHLQYSKNPAMLFWRGIKTHFHDPLSRRLLPICSTEEL